MKLILEFDDFNPLSEVNCLSEIKYLVSKHSNIKITLFTSALYQRVPLFYDKKWCEEVLELIFNDNIRLAVHGLYHTNEEFKSKTYDDASVSLLLAESIFTHSKLPFIKVFRGPHWGINSQTCEALVDLNYTHMYIHENYGFLQNTFKDKIKSVFYNWNLKDDFDSGMLSEQNIIVGHGHTHDVCGNGIAESLSRIEKCIINFNPTFLFADEY